MTTVQPTSSGTTPAGPREPARPFPAIPPIQCAPWCVDEGHRSNDPACWGLDRYVNLTMEYDYPHGALPGMAHLFDPPRIGVNPYRRKPAWRSVAYLHLYRPHDNDYLGLDTNLQVTSDEARQLAAHLVAVADVLDGAR